MAGDRLGGRPPGGGQQRHRGAAHPAREAPPRDGPTALIADWREYVSRFPRASRGDLLRLGWRYLRLHLQRGPTGRPLQPAGKAIICLTTIPSRIGSLAPTLRSLLDQTAPPAEIRLYLPQRSRREGRGYDLPGFLRNMAGVAVIRCERDWGPATRLIPALHASEDPDATLITVDDDTIYPPDLVATLLAWQERLPAAALAYRGWPAPATLRWADSPTLYGTNLSEPAPVDVLTSTWGTLVRPSFFDAAVRDYAAYPADAFFVDDLWFSGHLARRGVPRFVVPAVLPPLPRRLHRRNALFDRENADGRHNDALLRAFAPYWACSGGLSSK